MIGCMPFIWFGCCGPGLMKRIFFYLAIIHLFIGFLFFVQCSYLLYNIFNKITIIKHEDWRSFFYSEVISIGSREQLLRTSRTYCVADPISGRNQSDFNDYLVFLVASYRKFLWFVMIPNRCNWEFYFFMCFGHMLSIGSTLDYFMRVIQLDFCEYELQLLLQQEKSENCLENRKKSFANGTFN